MQTSPDPVAAAIALASVVFGPSMAQIVGPYAVILVAATVGAAWALGRRDPNSLSPAWYFARLQVTALLLTVGLAQLIGGWIGADETSWLLAPIALVVGALGDDWPAAGRWLIVRFGRLIERKADGG